MVGRLGMAEDAAVDEDGNRVWEGEQIDVGHHYIAMSRKEFQLDRVSPIKYDAAATAAAGNR